MSDVTRQTLTNDSGNFTSGTGVDAAFVNQVYDQVDDQCSSATNTQKPKATTDEVITARGSKASLNERLSVSLDSAGVIINSGGFALASDLASVIGPGSWVQNDDMRIWVAGDTSAPTGWTLAGAGSSIARNAAADAPVRAQSATITRVGTDVTLTQTLMATTANAIFVRGKYMSIGCYVYATAASRARIQVSDGVTTSVSSYHTGNSTWQWLSVAHLISASASALSVRCEVNNGNTSSLFTGFSAVLLSSSTALPHYIPCPTVERVYTYQISGVIAAGATQGRIQPWRMGFVRDVQLSIVTAPVGAALIVDINNVTTTMFVTRPQIADGLVRGSAQPDSATYATKCLTGMSGTSAAAGELIVVDVDQVGSGTPGSNLRVDIRCTEYSRPQERFIAFNEF